MAFQIFTDTSSGMSKELREQYEIEYFRMGLNVAGRELHGDLDYQEFSREQLYEWVKDPNTKITTSLVTAEEFMNKCEKYLAKGIDILYVACTDALSGTRGVFELVKKELQETFENNGKKVWEINRKSLMMSVLLLVWCVLSFSGVSEFLYFNF